MKFYLFIITLLLVGINFNCESINESEENVVLFAVTGDYSSGSDEVAMVSDLIKDKDPDFVITTGDNFHSDNPNRPLDSTAGKYYGNYIESGDFYPCIGGHDWNFDKGETYRDYFDIPDYYDIELGFVHLFCICSEYAMDGWAMNKQRTWLDEKLVESKAAWKIIYFHLPPFGSGLHGSLVKMQWDFKGLGIDLVLNGHDHHYEHLYIDSVNYVINGLGGDAIRRIYEPVSGISK